MPIFITESEVIYSLKAANREKNETISSLTGDIVELKKEVTILREALETVDRWLARERGILMPPWY